MAEQQVGFNPSGAIRVAKATLYVERMLKNGPSTKAGPPRLSPDGRWAKITHNGTDGKYSWVAVKQNDLGEWEEDTDWGQGDYSEETGFAQEARFKSKWVLEDSIVWLEAAPEKDFYQFNYSPGTHVAKLAAGESISGRTSGTPGSGTVTLQKVTGDSPSFEDGESLTVYNPFSLIETEEDSDEDLWIEIDFGAGGFWWVTGVDCPGEDA
jgi:hypothetical protein